MTSEAIILAGGLGKRLRSAVPFAPKAMALVAGRPFLHYLLADLDRQGVARVVLAVGYRREAIIDHFGTRFRGIEIAYTVEETLLGTGGAIRQALGATTSENLLVLNGDTWVEVDLAALAGSHAQQGALLTMTAVRVADVGRYGNLVLEGGRVRALAEKGGIGPGWINAGVYVIARRIETLLDLPAPFSFETDFLQTRLGELHPPAFSCTGGFIDIGVPADYERAQAMFESFRD